MPFGEGLYTEDPSVPTIVHEPIQYPYRTDFGNEEMAWYRLKSGEFPPLRSDHVVTGDLVKVGEAARSGQFRAGRSGELVNFTMPPFGSVQYLNAEADLRDVPLGTRCFFPLHQDEGGGRSRRRPSSGTRPRTSRPAT